MGHISNKIRKSLRNWTSIGVHYPEIGLTHSNFRLSHHSDVHSGAQARCEAESLTSQGQKSHRSGLVSFASSFTFTFTPLAILITFIGLTIISASSFFTQNAYAISSSVQITRSNPGAVQFMNGDSTSVQPSSAGTLVVGSDTINVNTNCSAGYDVYVSATSAGSRDLVLSGTTGSIPDNKRIAASSTVIGSETTLAKDTWGVGKTNSTFAGLQAYNASTTSMTPSFHDTTTGGKDFTFYYGANVSNVKTPGTYTGEVLYTVLAKATCVEYTLSFDTSSATSVPSPGTYNTRTIGVDETINLATISSSSNIRKTGYHITGWRNQNDTSETYGITGTVDVNPSDASSVILEPIWAANTYTVAYAAGNTGGSCSISSTSATYDQDVTLSSTKCTKTGYTQDGWSTSNSASNTKTYNLGQTLTKPNFTSTNGGTYTLYPHFNVNSHSVTVNTNTGISSTSGSGTYNYGQTVTIGATAASGYAFSSWTVNAGGVSVSNVTPTTFTMPDADVTITANAVMTVQNCSDTVHPTTSTGCKMADNKIWILGNNGNAINWNNMFTGATGVDGHNATVNSGICPAGYSAPTIVDYDNLIIAYSGTPYSYSRAGYYENTGAVYRVLGLSSNRRFWSSTEYYSSYAYALYVDSSDSGSGAAYGKTNNYYVLCLKSS